MFVSTYFFLRSWFSHFENKRFCSKSHVFSRHKAVEENVNAFPDGEGHGHNTVGTGHTIQAADEIRQIVQYWQVMLHYNNEPRQKQQQINKVFSASVSYWFKIDMQLNNSASAMLGIV